MVTVAMRVIFWDEMPEPPVGVMDAVTLIISREESAGEVGTGAGDPEKKEQYEG